MASLGQEHKICLYGRNNPVQINFADGDDNKTEESSLKVTNFYFMNDIYNITLGTFKLKLTPDSSTQNLSIPAGNYSSGDDLKTALITATGLTWTFSTFTMKLSVANFNTTVIAPNNTINFSSDNGLNYSIKTLPAVNYSTINDLKTALNLCINDAKNTLNVVGNKLVNTNSEVNNVTANFTYNIYLDGQTYKQSKTINTGNYTSAQLLTAISTINNGGYTLNLPIVNNNEYSYFNNNYNLPYSYYEFSTDGGVTYLAGGDIFGCPKHYTLSDMPTVATLLSSAFDCTVTWNVGTNKFEGSNFNLVIKFRRVSFTKQLGLHPFLSSDTGYILDANSFNKDIDLSIPTIKIDSFSAYKLLGFTSPNITFLSGINQSPNLIDMKYYTIYKDLSLNMQRVLGLSNSELKIENNAFTSFTNDVDLTIPQIEFTDVSFYTQLGSISNSFIINTALYTMPYSINLVGAAFVKICSYLSTGNYENNSTSNVICSVPNNANSNEYNYYVNYEDKGNTIQTNKNLTNFSLYFTDQDNNNILFNSKYYIELVVKHAKH
jgi:hypothetical protein